MKSILIKQPGLNGKYPAIFLVAQLRSCEIEARWYTLELLPAQDASHHQDYSIFSSESL